MLHLKTAKQSLDGRQKWFREARGTRDLSTSLQIWLVDFFSGVLHGSVKGAVWKGAPLEPLPSVTDARCIVDFVMTE